MKTVLEDLKDNIDYLFLNTKSDTDFQKGFISCLEHVQNFIETKKLLEVQKQQIKDACMEFDLSKNEQDHEDYYNEKFNK